MSFDQADLLKVHPARKLDGDTCCGRKTVPYPRPAVLFCSVCDRSYDPVSLAQVPNFSWVVLGDGFVLHKASAGAKIVAEMKKYQKGSGLDEDTYRMVVREEVEAFNVKYQEICARG